MTNTEEILLYDMAMSPFASIVRLVLAEKGLVYTKRAVEGMKHENLEPWFAHISPQMQCPALTVTEGDKKTTLTDSKDIIAYFVNDHPGGTPLVDNKEKRATWDFVDKLYEIEVPALYAENFRTNSPAMLDLMKGMQEKKVDLLEGNAKRYPELKDLYMKKKEKTLEYVDKYFSSPDLVATNVERVEAVTAAAEDLLKESEKNNDGGWLFGAYSVADAVFTCFLATLRMVNMVSFEDKPMLGKFWEKAKKRPSYASAGIIDAIPLKMKMMMLPLMLFFKIKASLAPLWSKGVKEVEGAKQAAEEQLDKVIGVSK